jgi:hypothetical protein
VITVGVPSLRSHFPTNQKIKTTPVDSCSRRAYKKKHGKRRMRHR